MGQVNGYLGWCRLATRFNQEECCSIYAQQCISSISFVNLPQYHNHNHSIQYGGRCNNLSAGTRVIEHFLFAVCR